jgi:hypothetical protein
MAENKFKDTQANIMTGAIRVIRLRMKYEDLGYKVISNIRSHEGPDLIAIHLPDGRIWKVIEATNWNKKGHLSDARLLRLIDSLVYFKGIQGIQLEVVFSYLENLSAKQKEEFESNGIRVTILGSQDLDYNLVKDYFEEEDVNGWE